MTEYRMGQRVRVVREGTVRRWDPSTKILRVVASFKNGADAYLSVNTETCGEITILSEPRPDEPMVPGTLVRGQDGDVFCRRKVPDVEARCWVRMKGVCIFYSWDGIKDPEILFVPEVSDE